MGIFKSNSPFKTITQSDIKALYPISGSRYFPPKILSVKYSKAKTSCSECLSIKNFSRIVSKLLKLLGYWFKARLLISPVTKSLTEYQTIYQESVRLFEEGRSWDTLEKIKEIPDYKNYKGVPELLIEYDVYFDY